MTTTSTPSPTDDAAPVFQPAPRLTPGTLIDERYEILEFLGEGGFATVYKARHVHIQRMVALKLLDTTKVPRNGEFDARFVREAQTAAQIDHPNVVTIHDFGFSGPQRQPYIAMELLEGHDLEQELERNGPLEPRRALRLFAACLEAIGEAHVRGIVHKDLKPSNLYLSQPGTERESLQILDFGVASINQNGSRRLTSTGQILGTPQYLAPEYIQKQLALPAFDVYLMGLILVEALSATPVVESDNPFTALMAHCQGSYEIPDCLLHSALGPVIQKALRIDYTERYPDANAFRAALLAVEPESLASLHGADMTARSRISQSAIADEAEVRASLEGGDNHRPAPPSPALATVGRDAHLDSGQLEVVLSSATDMPGVRASMSAIAALEPGSRDPERRRRAPLWIALAAVALLATGLAVYFLVIAPGGGGAASDSATPQASAAEPGPRPAPADAPGSRDTDAPGSRDTDAPAAQGAAITEPPEAADTVPPEAGSATDAAPAVAALAPSESALAMPEPAAPPEEVKLFLITEPSGARVFDGERELLTTPDVLTLPASESNLTLRFEKEGYVSLEETLVPSEDRTLRLELERVRSTKSGRRGGSSSSDKSTTTAAPASEPPNETPPPSSSTGDAKAVKIAP